MRRREARALRYVKKNGIWPGSLGSFRRLAEQRESAEHAGLAHRRRSGEVPGRELGEGGDAEQPEAGADLVFEDFQRAHQSRNAGGRETEAGEPSQADRFGAERDRLDDVGAAHESAVDPDFGAAGNRGDDLGQHRGAAQPVIELASAVVRHVDHLDAVLHGDHGILGGGNALDDQRQRVLVRVFVLVPLHLVPGKRGLVAAAGRGAGAPGLDEAADQVAFAPAVHGDVHREAEGRVAVLARAAHMVVHPRVIAAHVELIAADGGGRRRGRFQPGLADRRQHLRHAELRRGARCRRRAALDDGFQAADRREQHRQPHAPAEERRAGVDPAHIAQHPRPERDRVERLAVAAHRGFGLGAADEVAPGPGGQVGAGGGYDFLEGEERFDMGHVHGAQG